MLDLGRNRGMLKTIIQMMTTLKLRMQRNMGNDDYFKVKDAEKHGYIRFV